MVGPQHIVPSEKLLCLVKTVCQSSTDNEAVPGILSCVGFGLLSDKYSLSASTNTQISTMGSGLCVFLLWGLTSHRAPALLILFSLGYGFFASAYSATWGGWIKELEQEASEKNEAINTGMVYVKPNTQPIYITFKSGYCFRDTS